jgi:type II secretory pathway predicted ATPase ExeA/cell division septation protein DedD
MYLKHFELAVSPFGISPRLDFLYKSDAFEESMAHLVYGLDNSEAIVMITGAIGTGKTMAIQSFLSHLGDRFLSALITNTSVDGRELLKLILDDLGAPVEARADKSDLLIAFKKFLIAAGREGKRIVIVIDEAQNLPREVLEEIRQLTNLGQGEDQPVQIILVGQPELQAAVDRPDLAQLKQRIRVHYKLAPLSRRELEEYVDHRMLVAGGQAGVFRDRALDRIFQLSGGVPRVVNTLCAEALLAAFVAGRHQVEMADLEDHGAALPDSAMSSTPVVSGNAPQAEMAVRREAQPGPAPGATASAPPRAARSARRGWSLWFAAVAVVVVTAVLAATGKFDALWTRLPWAASGGGEAVSLPVVGEPAPGLIVAAAETAGTVAETVASPQLAATDTSIAVRDTQRTIAARTGMDGPQAAPAAWAEPIGREAAVAAAAPASNGEQFIHISSFRTAEHAGAVAAEFTARGLLATVRQQKVRQSLWYRVYLGPYGSHEDAVRLANSLRDEGSITYYKVVRLGAEEGL